MALTGWGSFAEQVAVAGSNALPIPPSMDFATAAAFSMTYGTSMHALKQRANLQPGETLLVLGASGGVGLAAVEIGKAMGARVIAAASSAEKLEVARNAGADELINYSEVSLKERLKELTGGQGVDVIYDPVGGKLFEEAFRSIAWNGRMLVVGFAAGGDIPALPANLPLLKGAALIGVFWGAFAQRQPQDNAANFRQLFAWHAEGKLAAGVATLHAGGSRPGHCHAGSAQGCGQAGGAGAPRTHLGDCRKRQTLPARSDRINGRWRVPRRRSACAPFPGRTAHRSSPEPASAPGRSRGSPGCPASRA